MKIIKFIVLLLLFVSFGTVCHAETKEDWPYYWKNTKGIKVYIPEHYERGLAKIGFNYWVDLSDNRVTFEYVDNKENAQIYVEFVNNVDVLNGSDGLCIPVDHRGNEFKKAKIKISERNKYGQRFNKFWIMQIARHEMGHAIGLYHNEYTRSAMYPHGADKANLDRDYDRKLLYEVYDW